MRRRWISSVGIASILAMLALAVPTPGVASSDPAQPDPAAASSSRPFSYRSPFAHRDPQLADKIPSGVEQSAAFDPAAVPVPSAAPVPACPSICLTTPFATMQDPDGASPGDPTGAGGDSHVVAAVNVSMAVYSKAGVEEVAPQVLGNLVTSPLPFYFDPKIVYDQNSDHYIVVFLGVKDSTQESEIYVVSIPDATATNQSTWCAREVQGDQSPGNGKQWADYPGVGYDQSRVYVSTNMFNFGSGGEGSQVIAFDKAGLFDCGVGLTSTTFTTDDVRLKDGTKIWTLQPATTVGAANSPEYALATDYHCPGGNCQGDALFVASFNGSNFSARLLPTKSFTMPTATQEGTPLSQPEAYWDAGDLRFANAFYDSDTNQLFAAHAIEKDINKGDGWVESVARWYELAPGSPLKNTVISRIGNVGTSKKDAGWPVVGSDSDGNVWVNYSRASGASGAKEFLGAWVALILPGQKSPAEIMTFATGSSLYAPFPGPERWGDYNGINRDPVTGTTMWLVNQRAANIDEFQQIVTSADNV